MSKFQLYVMLKKQSVLAMRIALKTQVNNGLTQVNCVNNGLTQVNNGSILGS